MYYGQPGWRMYLVPLKNLHIFDLIPHLVFYTGQDEYPRDIEYRFYHRKKNKEKNL